MGNINSFFMSINFYKKQMYEFILNTKLTGTCFLFVRAFCAFFCLDFYSRFTDYQYSGWGVGLVGFAGIVSFKNDVSVGNG